MKSDWPAAWRSVAVCSSTNDLAAEWARAGAPAGAVIVADAQTAGRGRLGRRWHSPPGESLYLSIVMRPSLEPRLLPPITLAAAVALAETVAALGARPTLKWPNDVLVDGRKLAGILTEAAVTARKVEHVVVGIGVNLGTREFPVELAERATSLALVLGRDFPPSERESFARALCERLAHWHDVLVEEGSAAVASAWRSWPSTLGARVTVDPGGGRPRVTGVAHTLDDEGVLWLRTDEGASVRVVAGEIEPAPAG